MPLQTSFNLRASDGGIWMVTVDVNGLLNTARASGPYATPVFKATNGSAKRWLIGVTTIGLLTTTAMPDNTEPSVYFWRLWDPTGAQQLICIDENGTLLSTENCMPPFTGGFIVGQLMTQLGGYPTPVQPGGPGTPVTDPTQTTGEKNSMFTAGCGHFFNSWNIRIQGDHGCPTAYVCCPICEYIQRKIAPPSLLDDQANFIILA